jgi:hypothetical protein
MLAFSQELSDSLCKFADLLLDVAQLLERQRDLKTAPIIAILWHFKGMELFLEGLETQLTKGIVRLVLKDQDLVIVISFC